MHGNSSSLRHCLKGKGYLGRRVKRKEKMAKEKWQMDGKNNNNNGNADLGIRPNKILTFNPPLPTFQFSNFPMIYNY